VAFAKDFSGQFTKFAQVALAERVVWQFFGIASM
jgi:hypothetical protein